MKLNIDAISLTLLLFYFIVTNIVTFSIANHYSGRSGFFYVWSLFWLVSFCIAAGLLYDVVFCHRDYYLEWLTLKIPYFLPMNMGLIIDTLSVKMACIVLFISFCVQLFSFSYMRAERRLLEFMNILHIFTFFMLFFVFSSNLLQAFAAWEGLGFVSYLLINFWSARDSANKAGVKAIIFNRLADVWFIFSLLVSFLFLGSVDFVTITGLSHFIGNVTFFVPYFDNLRLVDVLAFSIFFAAVGKSAQLGYHVWLVAAMEGPSPVSALLHSATMVTAGVYLVLRCFDLFCNCTPFIVIFIIIYGLATCFFCGWFAFMSLDFKRVIAYSTCSHLGLMFTMVGFNFLEIAELHVHIHAFFKTTLFLCAGSMMSAILHLQNFRKVSSVALYLPICYSLFSFAAVSLLGFPFTVGSLSKERFIMVLYLNADISTITYLHFAASIVALLTALLYTVRLLLNTAFRPGFNGERRFIFYVETESAGLYLSQLILCIGVVIIVYIMSMVGINGLIAFNPWYWSSQTYLFYFIHPNSIPFLVKFYLLFLFIGFYFTRIIFMLFIKNSEIGEKHIAYAMGPIGERLNLNLNWRMVVPYFNRPLKFLNFWGTLFNYFEYYVANIFYTIIKWYLKLSFELFLAWERGFIEVIGPIGIVNMIRDAYEKLLPQLRRKKIVDQLYDITFSLILIFAFLIIWMSGISLSKIAPIYFFFLIFIFLF